MEDIEKMEEGTVLTIYCYNFDIKLVDNQRVLKLTVTPEKVKKEGFALTVCGTRGHWYGASEENLFRTDILRMWSRDPNRMKEFTKQCKDHMEETLKYKLEEVAYYKEVISLIENELSSIPKKSEPLTWYDIKFASNIQSMKVKGKNNVYTLYYQDYGEFEHLFLQDDIFGTNVFTANSNEPTQVEAFENLKLERID